MNGMKRQKDMTLKDEPLIIRSVSNMLLDQSTEIAPEGMKRLSKRGKQHPVVDVSGGESKV